MIPQGRFEWLALGIGALLGFIVGAIIFIRGG